MTDTHTLANNIGRAAMAAALDVGPTAISKYTTAQEPFPASWFDIMESLCIERGITCPRSLFSFKSNIPSDSPDLVPGDDVKVSCRAAKRVKPPTSIQGQGKENHTGGAA